MIFVTAFLQRVLSGLQSYFGYSKKSTGLTAITLLMMLFPLITVFFKTSIVLFGIFMIVNAVVLFMKMISFEPDKFIALKKYKDIHLWENFVTGGFFVYLAILAFNIKSIVLLCCSVYPALILHKGLINLGSGQNFFASATDDASGKTYGIPLLNIKIQRSSTKFRLFAAVGSLILAAILLLT